MKTHLYIPGIMSAKIRLQRQVTFLFDGQWESMSVLLIRYGMSEYYIVI